MARRKTKRRVPIREKRASRAEDPRPHVVRSLNPAAVSALAQHWKNEGRKFYFAKGRTAAQYGGAGETKAPPEETKHGHVRVPRLPMPSNPVQALFYADVPYPLAEEEFKEFEEAYEALLNDPNFQIAQPGRWALYQQALLAWKRVFSGTVGAPPAIEFEPSPSAAPPPERKGKGFGGALNPSAALAFSDFDSIGRLDINRAHALEQLPPGVAPYAEWQRPAGQEGPQPLLWHDTGFGTGQIPDYNWRAMREWTRARIEQAEINNAGPISARQRELIRRDALEQLRLAPKSHFLTRLYPSVNPYFAVAPTAVQNQEGFFPGFNPPAPPPGPPPYFPPGPPPDRKDRKDEFPPPSPSFRPVARGVYVRQPQRSPSQDFSPPSPRQSPPQRLGYPAFELPGAANQLPRSRSGSIPAISSILQAQPVTPALPNVQPNGLPPQQQERKYNYDLSRALEREAKGEPPGQSGFSNYPGASVQVNPPVVPYFPEFKANELRQQFARRQAFPEDLTNLSAEAAADQQASLAQRAATGAFNTLQGVADTSASLLNPLATAVSGAQSLAKAASDNPLVGALVNEALDLIPFSRQAQAAARIANVAVQSIPVVRETANAVFNAPEAKVQQVLPLASAPAQPGEEGQSFFESSFLGAPGRALGSLLNAISPASAQIPAPPFEGPAPIFVPRPLVISPAAAAREAKQHQQEVKRQASRTDISADELKQQARRLKKTQKRTADREIAEQGRQAAIAAAEKVADPHLAGIQRGQRNLRKTTVAKRPAYAPPTDPLAATLASALAAHRGRLGEKQEQETEQDRAEAAEFEGEGFRFGGHLNMSAVKAFSDFAAIRSERVNAARALAGLPPAPNAYVRPLPSLDIPGMLRNAYIENSRVSSQQARERLRRDALEQLRARNQRVGAGLNMAAANGANAAPFTSSINVNNPGDGVWFDPHSAAGPTGTGCCPYPNTNGGYGADPGFKTNQSWQFPGGYSGTRMRYRSVYWTPYGWAGRFKETSAKDRETLARIGAQKQQGDLFATTAMAQSQGAIGSGFDSGMRLPQDRHWGNDTSRWQGGVPADMQSGRLNAGAHLAYNNGRAIYPANMLRGGDGSSVLHIGYTDTGVPQWRPPTLTPYRSPLTPGMSNFDLGLLHGGRDRSGFAKTRLTVMPRPPSFRM